MKFDAHKAKASRQWKQKNQHKPAKSNTHPDSNHQSLSKDGSIAPSSTISTSSSPSDAPSQDSEHVQFSKRKITSNAYRYHEPTSEGESSKFPIMAM